MWVRTRFILSHHFSILCCNAIKIYHIHRVAGTATSETTRDMLCHVNYFWLKEEIPSKAWYKRSVDLDEAAITFFADLSSHTLYSSLCPNIFKL